MAHLDNNQKPYRTILLEEHYATKALLKNSGNFLTAYARIAEQLCDLDAQRIAEMDATGIDMQVLTLTSPGVEQLDAGETVVLPFTHMFLFK